MDTVTRINNWTDIKWLWIFGWYYICQCWDLHFSALYVVSKLSSLVVCTVTSLVVDYVPYLLLFSRQMVQYWLLGTVINKHFPKFFCWSFKCCVVGADVLVLQILVLACLSTKGCSQCILLSQLTQAAAKKFIKYLLSADRIVDSLMCWLYVSTVKFTLPFLSYVVGFFWDEADSPNAGTHRDW